MKSSKILLPVIMHLISLTGFSQSKKIPPPPPPSPPSIKNAKPVPPKSVKPPVLHHLAKPIKPAIAPIPPPPPPKKIKNKAPIKSGLKIKF